MGPFRSYNQVEISASDAYKLGLNPPVRESGDLSAGEAITLLTTKNEITLNNACIIAQRHLHMNNETASKLGFKNKEKINIKVSNEKGGTMDATVKITEKGYYEVHIDMDDANCFLLKSGDEVEIER